MSERDDAVTGGRRSRFGADLKTVLAERDFRKLFGTRLVAQTGDGIVTAAVGTYVFFNASTFPNPMAGAAAFAVLYLPYSLIGPFAGVFLDRWSRRQILVWSAPIRGALVVVTAGLMVADIRSVPLYIAVLAVSAVSRFLLSALSVAIPHVTPANKLVVANAVSDTIGGMMSALGGIIALGINAATGDTERGAAVTMLVGGGCYVAAGVVATIMPKDLLGPSHVHRGTGRVGTEFREVAEGLLAGARYVLGQRGPRSALGATSAYSFLFGPLFLMTILLYRNYFFPAQVTVAESHVGRLAVFSAVGYVCAALITPPATRRLSKQAWITLMLIGAAVVTAVIGETFNETAYLALGFLMYLTRQGVAIAAVTILQEGIEDGFRGRVFAFYDMVYNAAYAIGAALFAVFMPFNGKSSVVVGVIAAGFLVAAFAYWLSAGGSPAGGSPAEAPSAETGPSPSAAAQRSSS
ncbi:MAG TPA: MFS transporter [Trebonia sp.]|nr:MFS transporter [Trebonia sp.]